MSHSQEQIKHWLTELGNMHGAVFQLDAEGNCELNSNNHTLVISAPSQSDNFFITILLQDVPSNNKEAIFETILTLNLHQQHTRGATIAIDPISNMLVLCYCRETDSINFSEFSNITNNLLEISEDINQKITDSILESNQPHSPSLSNIGIPLKA